MRVVRVHKRPARPLTLTLSLVLSVAATVFPAAAHAEGDSAVRLPVMHAQLDDGDRCTGRSPTVVASPTWERQSLDLPRTWQFADGAGVAVAVVDTGVSVDVRSLSGRVADLGAARSDCVGHGTFVAGIIAAAHEAGVGFQGVAPSAHIIGVRGTDKRGAATATTVAQGIDAAVDAGADVIEVSLALGTSSKRLDDAIGHAAAKDVLIVAAAVPDASPSGSSRATSSPPPPRNYWPAAAPGVLSVVDTDVNGRRADNAWVPLTADLAAPGDGVVSNGPVGRGHYIGSGSSLAAAYVAGTAALVRSAFPDLGAQDVARRLVSNAYPDSLPRLDPYAAVTSLSEGNQGSFVGGHSGPAVLMPQAAYEAEVVSRALTLAAVGAGLTIVVGWAAWVLPRGRSRRWRAAGK
ncbi:S8 family serine peptidase [Streptomyces sp. NPDC059215]|uniref:S8 family serine peptidase n=1 Tax=Streptomyces sp. NPDC059215 TaxID=3346772 RepID=UPI00368AE81D